MYSKIPRGEKNFDFALDRPTDYLFDYNYLGHLNLQEFLVNNSLLLKVDSNQNLDTAFANQWLTSLNASASIWKFVQAYGDIG